MKVLNIDNLSDISKGVLKEYMVRKSVKEKDNFATYLKENLPEFENFKVEEINKNKNIVIGDINNCKYVFTAHYDTPATMLFFPNFLTPKNPLVFIIYQIIMGVLIAGIAMLFGFLGTLINFDFRFGLLVGLFLICHQLLYGYPNKNNYNDNTSGVITLIELYLSLSVEERKKCTFVFFDNEEKGLKGSKAFKKRYEKIMEERELINFDCVADGNHILLIHKKISEETLNKLSQYNNDNDKEIIIFDAKKTIYPSDQKNFKHSMGVAVFNKNKLFGYYVARLHTMFDTTFDEKNIFVLVEIFKSLLIEK